MFRPPCLHLSSHWHRFYTGAWGIKDSKRKNTQGCLSRLEHGAWRLNIGSVLFLFDLWVTLRVTLCSRSDPLHRFWQCPESVVVDLQVTLKVTLCISLHTSIEPCHFLQGDRVLGVSGIIGLHMTLKGTPSHTLHIPLHSTLTFSEQCVSVARVSITKNDIWQCAG